MPTIKRKTKKAFTKQVKKLVKKHGPEVALGIANALVDSVITAATDEEKQSTEAETAAGKPVKSETKTKKSPAGKKKPRKAAKKKRGAAAKKAPTKASQKGPQSDSAK